MNKDVIEKLGHIILDVLELSDVEIEDAIEVLAKTASALCITYSKVFEIENASVVDLFLHHFNESIKYLKLKQL